MDWFDGTLVHQDAVVSCLTQLLAPIAIMLTSRPAALEGHCNSFAGLGAEGRRVAHLTPESVHKLSAKILLRSGAPAEGVAMVLSEATSKEYASLTRVPITLGLTVHVLSAGGARSSAVPKVEVY